MRLLIERSDGGCTLMHLVEGADLDKAVKDWKAVNPQWSVVSVQPIVDEPNHEFFDGWKHVGGGRVGFDMGKCREIHRNKMRAVRAPKLAALDVEYQRADESGDVQKKHDIAKAKQELRDITKHPQIEAANTPEDLKKFWPDSLS